MPQAPWSAGAVEARAVAALLPYAGNARTHSAEQVAQIAASILEFGFVAPVLVDERGEIIAGHGRLLAATSLGLDTVPTIVRGGLTEAQKAAYRLADNRIALNAGWDEALLAAEVAKLQEMGGVDLALTGFDGAEIERLLAGLETEAGNLPAPAVASGAEPAPGNQPDADGAEPGEDPADSEPEPPRQTVARVGDIWLLGEHRLACGDSTNRSTVAREAAEDLDAAVDELAVGRVRHRLGLDGGVDRHPLEVLRLGGAGALGGGERLGEQQFELLGADALAPAGHGGAIERQGVLEMGFAAEELDIRAVQEARADGVVGETVHVLKQVQADHEAGRKAGPADTLAVERAEGDGEALPVDQARQAHQGMAAIDQVHQGRAEEFGVLGWRRLRRHWRSPGGDAPRESRRSAAINRSAELQGFQPLRTARLQTRILAPTEKPRKPEGFRVVHG